MQQRCEKVRRTPLVGKRGEFEMRTPTVRTLDNVVLRLRKLLEPDPAQPRHLLTVRGLGFRFEP